MVENNDVPILIKLYALVVLCVALYAVISFSLLCNLCIMFKCLRMRCSDYCRYNINRERSDLKIKC